MKKEYSKPRIIIDDFSITQNIASCGYAGGNKYSHSSPEKCTWDIGGGVTVFAKGTGLCMKEISPGEKFGEICYNNPSGITTVFGSY